MWLTRFVLVFVIAVKEIMSGDYFVPVPKSEGIGSQMNAVDLNLLEKHMGKEVEYPWIESGLFEGDIPIDTSKNALLDETLYWTLPVPVFIKKLDFDEKDEKKIRKGMREIERKTCIKFRDYKFGDEDYILVQSSENGCWSSVGRKLGGQQLNLQRPRCLKHGTVVHEFLHALGLYHQQSASERDEYVQIAWENIKEGKEYNFKKYDDGKVSSLNLTYDYQSVMHYHRRAFSKNEKDTIVPRKHGVEIGQRDKMSDLDAKKIRIMYKCNETDYKEDEYDFYFDIMKQ